MAKYYYEKYKIDYKSEIQSSQYKKVVSKLLRLCPGNLANFDINGNFIPQSTPRLLSTDNYYLTSDYILRNIEEPAKYLARIKRLYESTLGPDFENCDYDIYVIERNRGELIETIKADESEYPENGIKGEYWYIRKEKAFPSLKIITADGLINIGGGYYKDSNGVLRPIANVYYKDSQGVVRQVK